MTCNEILSVASIIAMAMAFWCSRAFLQGNAVFILQIAGYLLLAASSWLIGVHSTAFVLILCAFTLFLKMIHRFQLKTMAVFAVITLLGGLILNDHGWVGILPILASVGVVVRHTYQYRLHLPSKLVPLSMRNDIREYSWTVLSKMDNANRQSSHALDLFLENIIGVILWGAYAWLINDRYTFYWRCFMLAVNLLNYLRRMKRIFNRLINNVLPAPSRSKRRKLPRKKNERDWII